MSLQLRAIKSTADASEAGFDFQPTYPDSPEPTGATIVLRGPHSQAVREQQRRRVDLARRRTLTAKRAGKEPEELSLDEIEAAMVQLAVAHTMGWRDIDDGNEPFAYSPEAAVQLYTQHPWLRDQVITEGQKLGNFIRPNSTSSTSTPPPSSGST